MKLQQDADKAIILFDGVCNLCNTWVQRVVRHDAQDYFRFASLQSDAGQQLLARHQMQLSAAPESVVLIESGKIYQYSTAALRIAGRLSGAFKLLYLLLIVPAFLRDRVYKLIARNRYKWWGRRQSCMVPTEALEAKFL